MPSGPTNRIGTTLAILMKDYDLSASALARAIGHGQTSVSKWLDGGNIGYPSARRLCLVFGVRIDALSDTGKFNMPFTPKFDEVGFANFVVNEAVFGDNHAFRIDATKRANDWLATPSSENEWAPPKVAEVMPKISLPDPDKTGIKATLSAAEAFRKKHDLTWVIREDGSLGAQRVVTEDF